jgi:hypothetical protein
MKKTCPINHGLLGRDYELEDFKSKARCIQQSLQFDSAQGYISKQTSRFLAMIKTKKAEEKN